MCCFDHIKWSLSRLNTFLYSNFSFSSFLSNAEVVFFILIADQILILMIHSYRPDSRVIRLIKRMGAEPNPKQIRILCLNKVDLIEKKKELLKVAEQFKDLPGYER